jgi:hypothetical protein
MSDHLPNTLILENNLMSKVLNCGACGLYIGENEQDIDGYHRPELCAANSEMSFAEYLNSIHPLTVADMKAAIAGLPDDTQILFEIPAGTSLTSDWYNVSKHYERPDSKDSNYLALTFAISDNYDSRQF